MTEFPLVLIEKSSVVVAWISCQCRICAIARKVQNVKIQKNTRNSPVFTRKIIDFRRFAFVSVSEPPGSQKGRNLALFPILRPRISTNRRSDESTNRRIDEATKRRIDDATNRRIDESTNRRIDESTNPRPGGMREAIKLFCQTQNLPVNIKF